MNLSGENKMKKLLLALLGAFILSAVPAFATTVNVASDGMVWIEKSQPAVTKVEVAFDEGVLELGDAWKQAFAKKGTVVSIKTHNEYRRNGLFFHIEKVSVVDVGVVYDGTRVSMVRGTVGGTETSFTPYMILWFLSTTLMLFGVLHKGKDPVGIAVAVGAFITTIATAAAASFVVNFMATLAAFIAACIVALVFAIIFAGTEVGKRKKVFYIAVVWYYTSMATSMATFLSR